MDMFDSYVFYFYNSKFLWLLLLECNWLIPVLDQDIK